MLLRGFIVLQQLSKWHQKIYSHELYMQEKYKFIIKENCFKDLQRGFKPSQDAFHFTHTHY